MGTVQRSGVAGEEGSHLDTCKQKPGGDTGFVLKLIKKEPDGD